MSIKYLALGDSYTIGEAVAPDERWPHVLQGRLVGDGLKVDLPKIIATTGWTTDELLVAIQQESPANNFDLVSLLIGVNNQYRGFSIDTYVLEFNELLDLAIVFAGNVKSKVFVVSIPNYGVTPFGKSKDEPKITREIDQYNAIAQTVCEQRGIAFVNITPGSQEASEDLSLVAEDGLHPSAKMYKQWVDLIHPVAKEILLRD